MIDILEDKTLDKNTIDVVMYHGNCRDGHCSAFIVWHYFKNNFGIDRANSIKYIPCSYNNSSHFLELEIIPNITRKNIIMCDFSFQYSDLNKIINVSKSFLILDHHKTSQKDLEKIPDNLKIFDMKKSGVGLTWQYFFPTIDLPRFLAFVQDRDIWTNAIPDCESFIIYFYEQPFEFELYEKYFDDLFVNDAIIKGKAWIDYRTVIMKNIMNKTSYIIQEIDKEYRIVLYINCSELKSDLGSQVFTKYPFGDFSAIWNYDLTTDKTYYSLRSTNDRLDVEKIAKYYGGGGHRNASGLSFGGTAHLLPILLQTIDEKVYKNFKRIDDYGLLNALVQATNSSVKLNSVDVFYIEMTVTEIKKEWFSDEKLFDLIKRKCDKYQFIVFREKTDEFIYDDVKNDILFKYQYNIFYNEKSVKNAIKQLPLVAMCATDKCLTFNTHLSFMDIINKTSTMTEPTPISDSDDEKDSIMYSDDETE